MHMRLQLLSSFVVVITSRTLLPLLLPLLLWDAATAVRVASHRSNVHQRLVRRVANNRGASGDGPIRHAHGRHLTR